MDTLSALLERNKQLFPWIGRVARSIWRGVREWCGDAAYERYMRSACAKSRTPHLLSPTEFYVEQLNRRYSRPNRCC